MVKVFKTVQYLSNKDLCQQTIQISLLSFQTPQIGQHIKLVDVTCHAYKHIHTSAHCRLSRNDRSKYGSQIINSQFFSFVLGFSHKNEEFFSFRKYLAESKKTGPFHLLPWIFDSLWINLCINCSRHYMQGHCLPDVIHH